MKPSPKNGLSRAERLRGRSNLSELFSSGASGFVYPIRFLWRERKQELRDCEALVSVLFTVPKRSHKRANKRNRLRRQLKEAYRLQKYILLDEVSKPLDVALIFIAKEEVDYKHISRSVSKILKQIAASEQAESTKTASAQGEPTLAEGMQAKSENESIVDSAQK